MFSKQSCDPDDLGGVELVGLTEGVSRACLCRKTTTSVLWSHNVASVM